MGGAPWRIRVGCDRVGRDAAQEQRSIPQIHQELQRHKELTLQLVWQEGRERDPEGYGYSRFCDL